MDLRLQNSVSVCRRMKLLCSLWFLLLLGLGSLLLLLVHLPDLTDTVLQQNPGVPVLMAPRWTMDQESAQRSGDPGTSRVLIPPPGLPSVSSFFSPLLGNKRPVTKRHRKLLLKTPPPGGQEVLQQPGWTQKSRLRLLKQVCSKLHPFSSRRQVTRQQVSRIYVEDRFRLLYCEVPKAGCSNWKRVLMVLGGSARSTQDIPHDVVHYSNRLRRLESYERAGLVRRLRSYTKVLFVREPFQRLVSAFRDKFESPNRYYHPVFGRAIISRYRANATSAALSSGAGVTFREFVRYLLDVRRPVGLDIHWEPVSRLCSPCLLRYHFIGKFESLEEDANLLLSAIRAPANLTFPDFKDRNPKAERTSSRITQRYFSQLNATERQQLFDFYYLDYLLFNYPKPFSDLH
ncbi:carbohydrate sulfotransferase 8 [Austrofundulus limnaeus]|uniref:Carbohydrate sulfotransferase n=1 Tax=Austrofundulus limnaeus TaxID=52670 RepID=A0A2I4CQH0_AUSLI|nr:PREDICTED: carbohydrate sulfotransferase 8-like [Austrofundulus limnaeus]XP_013882238.1 PREDICTED: carbohydrate sulfotransferase 8-like [Austrofundulus limnaeus]XP_013882240.1 PREDICTED: carbohydrate sulfotransferase 8-like [Austrofundulus limnaeus]